MRRVQIYWVVRELKSPVAGKGFKPQERSSVPASSPSSFKAGLFPILHVYDLAYVDGWDPHSLQGLSWRVFPAADMY